MTLKGLDAFKKAKAVVDGNGHVSGDMRDAAFFAAGVNYVLLLLKDDMNLKVGELDLERGSR